MFVTAYDKYAVAAFEQGAVDYVMKPFSRGAPRRHHRAAQGAARRPARRPDGSCKSLATTLTQRKDYLRWITAAQGDSLRLITVDEICYFRADHKYTLVVTPDSEALIRRPLKALAEEVDPQAFWQIHRSALVNVKQIAGVSRDLRGHLTVKLKQRQGDAAGRARTTCICSSRCRLFAIDVVPEPDNTRTVEGTRSPPVPRACLRRRPRRFATGRRSNGRVYRIGVLRPTARRRRQGQRLDIRVPAECVARARVRRRPVAS